MAMVHDYSPVEWVYYGYLNVLSLLMMTNHTLELTEKWHK